MVLDTDWKCNGFIVCERAAKQCGSSFNELGTWLHVYHFGAKTSHWEFRFYLTGIN